MGLFEDLTKEIIGAFVLGITAIMFIFILVAFGQATGQNEITNQVIQAIIILVGGVGIPIGIIALIKWLGDFSNDQYY
jgi:hypothetical protein